VRLLGDLDAESYRRTVARTTVAVQLREMSMGESPASVADCLAAGVPTIASAVGAVRELPDDAVVKVAPDVQAEPLGELVLALMNDAPRRTSLRSAGQALARDRSFEHAAQFLRENVLRRDHAAA